MKLHHGGTEDTSLNEFQFLRDLRVSVVNFVFPAAAVQRIDS